MTEFEANGTVKAELLFLKNHLTINLTVVVLHLQTKNHLFYEPVLFHKKAIGTLTSLYCIAT